MKTLIILDEKNPFVVAPPNIVIDCEYDVVDKAIRKADKFVEINHERIGLLSLNVNNIVGYFPLKD